MENPEWYAAKTVYKSRIIEDGTPKARFEERVVLFHATDFLDAIAKAEVEAEEYCSDVFGTEYLGFVNVYHLFDKTINHGTEVYSLMRESDLSTEEYLDHFYDDGNERTQTVE
ncbi:MAG: DUF4288 domain-containing protein [Chthonomonadales bacterium]